MLISIAVDFRHANVATRERFHLTPERIARMYECDGDLVRELVCVATCNRSEVYAWTGSSDPSSPVTFDHTVTALARRWMPGRNDAKTLLSVARRQSGLDVARRLMRIAAGLESQVVGDGQILGQLKDSYRSAADAGAAGSVLHRLFETSLRTGKRVQTETSLTAGRRSIGAEAAAVAHRRFGNLEHARVVIIGCGKTGLNVARQVTKLGARDVVMVNRTIDRAQQVAEEVGGRWAAWEALHVEVAMADIAIVATAALEPIVRYQDLQQARENCGTSTYPLMLVDLAMPRNIDPALTGAPGVTLVDLDALHIPVLAAEESRRSAAPAADAIVEAELQSFVEWVAAAAARDAIRPLREALEEICRRELTYAAGEELAGRTTERIVAKILARPMVKLRTALAHGEALHAFSSTLDSLFTGPVTDREAREEARPAPRKRKAGRAGALAAPNVSHASETTGVGTPLHAPPQRPMVHPDPGMLRTV